MLYQTKFLNNSEGKVRVYEDKHGHGFFFMEVGQELIIQTNNKRELWSPYAMVEFLEKEQVKTKKRPKWTNPFSNEDWVLKLHNKFGLPWEMFSDALSDNVFCPKGIEVYHIVNPMSYNAKFKSVTWDEPYFIRKMMALSPGLMKIVKRDNMVYELRSRNDRAKLKTVRLSMKDEPLQTDPDMV